MEDDSATEILEATYRALCEHGYADLTIGDIAAEADSSKALVHYYYDSKENLFTEFLDYLFERYTDRFASVEGGTPRDRLFALLEATLADERTDHDQEFYTAMLEVKAQAPYDDAIQGQLARFDEFLFDRARRVVADGVESGDFDPGVDPTLAAEFLTTAISGAHTRRITADRSPEQLREVVTQYVARHLLADGVEVTR